MYILTERESLCLWHTESDMKKLISLIAAAAVALCLAGCSAVPETGSLPLPGPQEEQGPEYVIPGREKEILPLQYMPVSDEELEPEPPSFEEISLDCPEVPEIRQTRYGLDIGLDVFADFIAERFGIYTDANWKVFVHYYDDLRTGGMAEFLYTVGEIDTNKAVIFQIEYDKAVRVYYKNLDQTADENGLLERVDMFRQRYEQERPVLSGDEHMEEEKFSYTYYYGTDKLVYCYNAFFSYGEHGVINNDWGTQCFIGEDGQAEFFGMSGGKSA